MRALKVVLVAIGAVFALTAGLFITAIVAAVSILFLLMRRLFGSPLPATATVREAQTSSQSAPAEIIDVTATEVRADAPRIERAPSP
jgi:hypothetical protein